MKNIESLKYIAFFLMIIDHIGYIYNIPEFRYVGRVVFPIFAYILVFNYINNTSNKINYLKRLFIFALISEPFFQFVFFDKENIYSLNILFTLFLGLGIIFLIEKKGYLILLPLSPFIFIIQFFISYNILGLSLIIGIYLYLINKKFIAGTIIMPSVIFINTVKYFIPTAMSFFFIKYMPNILEKRYKYFFYIGYPLHLFVLGLLKQI